MLKGKRQNINLSCFHLSNKRYQQQKSWFRLNTWSFMDWSRKYVSVTLREEYNFLDQQKRCFFSLKFIYISNKYFWDTLKNFLNKNSCSKDFWKPSVLVWHGQNCDSSQMRTKRVGAWPLCFFFIVTYIFDVFKFSFAKSRRNKIFVWWCHTNTHGTNLRSSPQGLCP